jgi:hypothetical protein
VLRLIPHFSAISFWLIPPRKSVRASDFFFSVSVVIKAKFLLPQTFAARRENGAAGAFSPISTKRLDTCAKTLETFFDNASRPCYFACASRKRRILTNI